MNGPVKRPISLQYSWSAVTSPGEVCTRAGGRRRYNAVRAHRASLRRLRVLELLGTFGAGHGAGIRIARVLGVSPATISRDLARLGLR